MAKQHSPEFLKISEAARAKVREVTVDQVKAKLDAQQKFHLIDVREESEWAQDHVKARCIWARASSNAISRTRCQIRTRKSCSIVARLSFGLGRREPAKMGYKNVLSMDGGIRLWREKNYPLSKD